MKDERDKNHSYTNFIRWFYTKTKTQNNKNQSQQMQQQWQSNCENCVIGKIYSFILRLNGCCVALYYLANNFTHQMWWMHMTTILISNAQFFFLVFLLLSLLCSSHTVSLLYGYFVHCFSSSFGFFFLCADVIISFRFKKRAGLDLDFNHWKIDARLASSNWIQCWLLTKNQIMFIHILSIVSLFFSFF